MYSKLKIKEIRKPKNNEKIFFVNTFGAVDECLFDEQDEMINRLIDCGNFYFTYKDAEFAARKEKYTRLYDKYISEFGGFCDWANAHKPKWFGYWDITTDKPRVTCGGTIKLPCPYATSSEAIEEAIEFINEDNFKKYITNTTDVDLLRNNDIFADFGDGDDKKIIDNQSTAFDEDDENEDEIDFYDDEFLDYYFEHEDDEDD